VGQCIHTKTAIRRYNEIRYFIARKLAISTDFQVIEEASIETPSVTFKPDLVVIHRERVQVICHEDMGYSEKGHNSKIENYTPLLPELAKQLKTEPGRVLPTVIGTRDELPKSRTPSSHKAHRLRARRYTKEIHHRTGH